MSYNSYSNNKNANKPYEPDVYTPYRFNNAESSVDKTCLTFSIWNRSLKISIAPRKENSEEVAFDMEKGVTVYLNHTKARILHDEIQNFLRDPDTYNGSGIPTGQGIITISNGKEFGSTNPVLTIRKVDELGNVVSCFVYEFKTDYYYSVRNYDGGMNFNKEFDAYRYLEIQSMLTMLEEYYKAMTYTIAYSVIEANKYNQSIITNRLNSLCEKMGIETNRSSKAGSKYTSSTSFFNNAGSGSNTPSEGYVPATIDDIE